MIRKLLTSALFAGCGVGLIATALHLVFVQPILLEAELYEVGELTHFAMAGEHDHAVEPEAEHDDEQMSRGLGIDFARDGLTLVFTMFLYTGYAFFLAAGFAFAKTREISVTAKSGLLWGIAGFVAFQFAPAAGLPLELPGTAGAEVTARQIWWLGTAIATGLGLWLIAFGQGMQAYAFAVVLILAPHLIGAPHPDEFLGYPPPELASLFASRALAIGMASWALLGLFAGYLWQKDQA